MTPIVLLLAILAAAPASLQETRRSDSPALLIRAEAKLDSTEVRLSGELSLTLTVDGPVPLEVTRPKPLLSGAGLWRVREEGIPLRELLPNDRQRWVMTYRLAPLIPGDAVKVSLSPLSMRAGTPDDVPIAWANSFTVKVTTSITQASADDLRPATGIENGPSDETIASESSPLWWVVVPVALAGIAWFMRRRRHRSKVSPEIHDADWLRQQLAGEVNPDQLVRALKLFLGHCFSRSFEPDTSLELVRNLRDLCDGPLACIDRIERLLQACDGARFSGRLDLPAEWREELGEITRQLNPAGLAQEIAHDSRHQSQG